jgi:hypothetical protein
MDNGAVAAAAAEAPAEEVQEEEAAPAEAGPEHAAAAAAAAEPAAGPSNGAGLHSEEPLLQQFGVLWEQYAEQLAAKGFFADTPNMRVPNAQRSELGVIKRANLEMARTRTDILYSLPLPKLEALAGAELPYSDRKVLVTHMQPYLLCAVATHTKLRSPLLPELQHARPVAVRLACEVAACRQCCSAAPCMPALMQAGPMLQRMTHDASACIPCLCPVQHASFLSTPQGFPGMPKEAP